MKKEEFKEREKEMIKMLSNCSYLIYDLEYLTTNPDAIRILNTNLFIVRLYGYLWRILILDLMKLFYYEENFSFQKFINILVNNYSKINWKNKILKEDLTALKSDINNIDIKLLKTYRDKVISHTDATYQQIKDEIHLDEVKIIFNKGCEVFDKISIALNDSQHSFDRGLTGKIDSIIYDIKTSEQTNNKH